MKSYTDIEQSKKMAEILPIETADMHYFDGIPYFEYKQEDHDYWSVIHEYLPCWSLAALLNILPVSIDEGQHCLALISSNPNGDIEWLCCYEDDKGDLMIECYADNQIDTCYEMILKLKENNWL